MLLLVWHFAKYLSYVQSNELSIPNPQKDMQSRVTNTIFDILQVNITIDIDFHGTPCELINMRINDIMGTVYEDVFSKKQKESGTENINRYNLNTHDQAFEKFKESETLKVNDLMRKL